MKRECLALGGPGADLAAINSAYEDWCVARGFAPLEIGQPAALSSPFATSPRELL
jgi:hypothetical protein